MRGRKPAEIKYNPNPIVGWQQWDLDGCLRLACAVAEDYGEEYRAVLYSIKRWGEEPRQLQRLEQIEDMCNRSFVGNFIDVPVVFERMREKYERNWNKDHS